MNSLPSFGPHSQVGCLDTFTIKKTKEQRKVFLNVSILFQLCMFHLYVSYTDNKCYGGGTLPSLLLRGFGISVSV
jgi:hypothetical protein